MSLYRFTGGRAPALNAPMLLVAFEGWVDAAGAATGAAEHVARDGAVVATFDADALIDYRARRPTLDIVDGDLKSLAWPEITVRHVTIDGRDLLVLSGPEPDYRWREFAASLHELVLRLGVIQAISIGSLGMAVPHTRPTQLLATASQRELLRPEDQLPEGFLRVPAACVSVLEMTLRDNGIPVVGFWARTPHYVGAGYAPAVLALVERIGRHLGVAFPLGSLVEEAAAQRRQLDEILEARPDVKEYVERLEQIDPGERLPSGDELAAEIERFLRQSRGEGGGAGPQI